MARLFTAGAEWNDTTTGNQDAVLSGTIQSTTVRSGSFAYAEGAIMQRAFTGVHGTAYYARQYVFVGAGTPGSNNLSFLLMRDSGTTNLLTVQIDTDMTIHTSVGSVHSSPLVAGNWYRVELMIQTSASAGAAAWELRLDGTTIESSSTWTQTTTPGNFRCSGVATNVLSAFDDLALNDSTGSAQTSWPGSGKVVLLKPISLNTNGGSWTDDAAATTSAALTNAIDNTPPNGIADTTAGGGNHQVRNAAANTSLDMNLTTYTTAGIGSTDTINVLVPMCNTGAPVVTAAKTGSLGITTNPTIANLAFANGATAAANFWQGTTAGTYPTGWKWERGTTTYGSTVTVGSSPVARVTITGGTTTRIAMVDALGMYVDYTPATTKSPPFQSRSQRNFLLRR